MFELSALTFFCSHCSMSVCFSYLEIQYGFTKKWTVSLYVIISTKRRTNESHWRPVTGQKVELLLLCFRCINPRPQIDNCENSSHRLIFARLPVKQSNKVNIWSTHIDLVVRTVTKQLVFIYLMRRFAKKQNKNAITILIYFERARPAHRFSAA